jgi:SnoaL-like domain
MEEQGMTNRPAQATAAAFRAAVERGDVAAVLDMLAPDVVFNSPIVHAPYVGRTALAPLLAAVVAVFADFHYTREFTAPDGHALQFETRIGERKVEGIDILVFNAAGLVSEFTVMVRPYSAATALRDAMAARLGQL